MLYFVDEVALDRIRAAFRQVLIVVLAAGGVGVAGDHEGRALQVGAGQRAAERLHRRQRLGADIGRVVVEGDLEIDIRLVLGGGGDLLALGRRQRARRAAADGLDQLGFRRVRRRIGLRGDREAAGQGLLRRRRQRADDLVLGDVLAVAVIAGEGGRERQRQRSADGDDGQDCGQSALQPISLPVPPARARAVPKFLQ